MSWIGSAIFSLAVLAAPAPQQKAPAYCDAELLQRAPKSPTRYQVRGDRCEGIYAVQVSTVSLGLRSFVKGFGEFNPETQKTLELTWKAPSGIVQDARIRALSLKSRTYYRMDTARPAAEGAYVWPTDVLAGEKLGDADLGILAWIEMPGPEGKEREVYLPLRAGSGESLDGYEVTFVPSRKLKKVLMTVEQIDEKGKKVRGTSITGKEMGGEFPHFPKDEPTVLETGKIGPPGYYRLQIKAAADSGEAVTKEIDFYHHGD